MYMSCWLTKPIVFKVDLARNPIEGGLTGPVRCISYIIRDRWLPNGATNAGDRNEAWVFAFLEEPVQSLEQNNGADYVDLWYDMLS